MAPLVTALFILPVAKITSPRFCGILLHEHAAVGSAEEAKNVIAFLPLFPSRISPRQNLCYKTGALFYTRWIKLLCAAAACFSIPNPWCVCEWEKKRQISLVVLYWLIFLSSWLLFLKNKSKQNYKFCVSSCDLISLKNYPRCGEGWIFKRESKRIIPWGYVHAAQLTLNLYGEHKRRRKIKNQLLNFLL
jgi:hypothetical protein